MSRDGAVETWSRVIRAEEEVPVACRLVLHNLFKYFPYCVRSPASSGEYGHSPASLVCLGEGRLAIINADDPASKPAVMSLESISAVESGRNLLLSWLALYHGRTHHVIWYNSVGYTLYEPFILAFRDSHEAAFDRGSTPMADLLEPMFKLDYKYYNRSQAVLGGRVPIDYLYHPATAITRRLLRRRIISPYLLVGTQAMLYVLSEESIVRLRRTACYSMVVRYIPRDAGYSLVKREDEELHAWHELFAADQSIMTIPVAASERDAFDSFVSGLRQEA
ncbi:MAG TPA: hypothetical protein VMX33_09355 [bacterium]|nr:hypothetical protein [bacterium]